MQREMITAQHLEKKKNSSPNAINRNCKSLKYSWGNRGNGNVNMESHSSFFPIILQNWSERQKRGWTREKQRQTDCPASLVFFWAGSYATRLGVSGRGGWEARDSLARGRKEWREEKRRQGGKKEGGGPWVRTRKAGEWGAEATGEQPWNRCSTSEKSFKLITFSTFYCWCTLNLEHVSLTKRRSVSTTDWTMSADIQQNLRHWLESLPRREKLRSLSWDGSD